MRKTVAAIDKILTFIEENILFIFLVVMLGSVFIGLANRYIFQESLRWTEELARYLLIWATFVGASLGVKKGVHISIDVLTVYLPEKINKGIRALSYIISIAFCITILYIGIPFVNTLMATNQLSPALRLPMYVVYGAVVVGCFLMAIRYLMVFITDIIYNEKPQSEDVAKVD